MKKNLTYLLMALVFADISTGDVDCKKRSGCVIGETKNQGSITVIRSDASLKNFSEENIKNLSDEEQERWYQLHLSTDTEDNGARLMCFVRMVGMSLRFEDFKNSDESSKNLSKKERDVVSQIKEISTLANLIKKSERLHHISSNHETGIELCDFLNDDSNKTEELYCFNRDKYRCTSIWGQCLKWINDMNFHERSSFEIYPYIACDLSTNNRWCLSFDCPIQTSTGVMSTQTKDKITHNAQ